PENIMESELFGHKKGSFTGAHETKPGKFELADEGTLFLDEIGNLPPHMQTKLLRFLQTHKFTPLGSTKPRKVETRVLAATNINIEKEIKAGNFREDLYYRLNVMAIEMPPLRKRLDDVPALSKSFLQRFAPAIKPAVDTIAPETMDALRNYHWPGNVRELENCIKYALAMVDGKVLTPAALPPYIFSEDTSGRNKTVPGSKKSLEQIEKEHILRVIENQNWNISAATRILGINRSTIYNKIEKYGLEKHRPD
ncbi:MAG: sigma 54-interacting transcriptional regulator, partial [bacterium]